MRAGSTGRSARAPSPRSAWWSSAAPDASWRTAPSRISPRSSAPANSTTIARIGPWSVHAACVTFAGQSTASPAATRRRSSPTSTQPPPSITQNQVVLGLSWGVMEPPVAKASSETSPRPSLWMTCPVSPTVPGGPSGRRCPTPKRRTSIGIGDPLA